MRPIFRLLILLSFTSCDKDNLTSDSSLSKENISGEVESIVESIYDTQSNNEIQTLRSKTIAKFNSKGYIIERGYYNSDESFSFKEIFSYDNSNLLTERISYNTRGEVISKDIYEYDSRHNLISNSQLIRYPLMKELTQQFNIKYEYKGTNQEKVVEEKWFVTNDSLAYLVIRKHNSDGDETEMTKYLGKSPIYETRFKYDNNHKLIEAVEIETRDLATVKFKTSFDYDEKGNIILAKKFGLTENHLYDINYKYSFDQNGNWIKRIKESSNEPTTITIREIKYFN